MKLLILLLALTSLAFAKKPNFLFIIVDDQSPFDLKAYDPKSPLDSPNIDRLANEGLSFKPVLTGEKKTVRDLMFGAYAGGTKPGMRSVKKGDWKLVKFDVLDGSVRETQLFNLKDNPHEFLPEHGKNDPKLTKLAEMEALLKSEMEHHADPYPLWNHK